MPLRHNLTGFSLVEVALAILVLGIGLAAVLTAMSYVTDIQGAGRDQFVALNLARQLLAEIDMQAFEEPSGTPVFGTEAGESGSSRAAFDDVDDYNGLTSTPPVDRTGTPIAGTEGLTCSVLVQSVDPWSPDTVVANGTSDAKRITITVLRANRKLTELIALRMRYGSEEDYQ